jgi:hypothetical protein
MNEKMNETILKTSIRISLLLPCSFKYVHTRTRIVLLFVWQD